MPWDTSRFCTTSADGLATITLNRPEKLNAWTMRMGAEVRHAALRPTATRRCASSSSPAPARATAPAPTWTCSRACRSGGNADALDVGDAELRVEFDPAVPAAFRGEYSYPLGLRKPVIAAVNGVAAGSGVSYMLYYDMRIASDRARFATIFSRRGLVAEHGSSWLLPRLIGMANACDLLYSGRFVTAEEALQMGLVNRVVAHDDLMSTVRDIATELATHCSPRSMRIMKRQLYGDLFTDLAASIHEADREMVASFTTADFREGVASFVQKRPPKFTGD